MKNETPAYIQSPSAKGITGSTLKIIALVSMLIDHTGAIILERMLVQRGISEADSPLLFEAFLKANAGLYYTDLAFRMIGRIAMPIFCFLLVQGFLHTRNVKRYLSRIFLFALISEVPFDLALSGSAFYWGYQNVFFTLFLGILAIAGIRAAEELKQRSPLWRVLCGLLIVGLCMGAAILLGTDYDMTGVLAIVLIYWFRRRTLLAAGLGCAALMELPAFVSLLPISLYNGERGISLKWIFYLFYPAHILLLYLIACTLGLPQF